MARLAVEHTASESLVDMGSATYSASVWSSGDLIKRRTDLGIPFLGPMTIGLARPVEAGANIPGWYPQAVPWSSTLDWVFLADGAAAANQRRLQLWTYNRQNSAFSYVGYVSAQFASAATYTVRGFHMDYQKYTDGLAYVATTAVAGFASTNWATSRLCSGSRIGFGTVTPASVTAWYEIASIASEASIVLTTAAPAPIATGAYVIEDLRAYFEMTATVTAMGGLHILKGLSYNDFVNTGKFLTAATTVDNIKASYFLRYAAVQTDTVGCGLGVEPKVDWTTGYVYTLGTPAALNYKMWKYNVRKALTLASGVDSTCGILDTATQTFVGAISQTKNGRLGVLRHGTLDGVTSFFFVTATRLCAARTQDILSAAAAWCGYTTTEVPPGGSATWAAGNALFTSVEIASTLDRLVVIGAGTAGVRNYITKFDTSPGVFDHIFMVDDKQVDSSGVSAATTPHVSILAQQQFTWVEGGLMYTLGAGITAYTNILHATPIGADWQYAATTNQRLITPKFTLPNCAQLVRFYANHSRILGDVNLGVPCDAYRAYYRTAGIASNTGSWTALPDDESLSAVGAVSEVQFMFEFDCIGDTMVPARIYSCGVMYEDLSTDSHYQPSVANSSIGSKYFAWRFATAFSSTVPTLHIKIYDAVAGGGPLIDDDTVAAASGTWWKSTDGGSSWSAYDTVDKANDITYIQYRPTSLADNIRARALLTQ